MLWEMFVSHMKFISKAYKKEGESGRGRRLGVPAAH